MKKNYSPRSVARQFEQYRHYGRQGPWTDIYSLGAVLYYALTLKAPCDPMTRAEDDRYTDGGELLSDPQKVRLAAEKFRGLFNN